MRNLIACISVALLTACSPLDIIDVVKPSKGIQTEVGVEVSKGKTEVIETSLTSSETVRENSGTVNYIHNGINPAIIIWGLLGAITLLMLGNILAYKLGVNRDTAGKLF